MKYIARIFSIILSIAFLLTGCENGSDSYSYLSQPDKKDESLTFTLRIAASLPRFAIGLKASEVYLNWGDNSKPTELVYLGNPATVDTIGPLFHSYTAANNYVVVARTLKLTEVNLNQVSENRVTDLSIANCKKLKRLFVANQPIGKLDLSGYLQLEELATGFKDGTQIVSALDSANLLKTLSVYGNLNLTQLNLSKNDSLRSVSLSQYNDLTSVNLTGLTQVRQITIDSCNNLNKITLGQNRLLQKVILSRNVQLNAMAINAVFRALPTAGSAAYTVILSGNGGDALCDVSIAQHKGWTVRKEN